MFTHINSWLRILLLCSLCSFLLALPPASSDAECPYEPLPSSLDTLSGVGFNGELHLHNEYYTPFTRGQNHLITFTLTKESAFRMYIEPHTVDIDIWLYNANTSLKHTSDYSLADEVVYATLPAGAYKIRVYFFGNFPTSCPTVTTEISIVPLADLKQRVSAFTCPSSAVFPDMQLNQVGKDGYFYDSFNTPNTILNVQNNNAATDYTFVKSYPFTVPALSQSGDNWEIEAVLGSHFPTSSLGLLLQDTNGANPPIDLHCFDSHNCSIASHNVRGQSTLKALVLPGSYVLWIYDVSRDRDTSLTTCIPFTFWFKISHAEQLEDFLNCPGEPFPLSFSEPGFLDENNYMYYREDILVNLTSTTNSVKFTVKQDSFFRAFTVAHRIDIDLKLLNSANQVLAYGYQYGSTEEGIQYAIPAGDYTFQMILFGKYNSVFCETALLEIAIAPKSLYKDMPDVCTGQTTSSPSLAGLAGLSTNASYSMAYNTYRYVYTSRSQTTIVSQQFNVSVPSYLQVQLGSNFLLGDIRILLTSTYSGNSSTQLGYHRRNMHFLDVLLPASVANGVTYTLSIVTSDTQPTAIVGFPPCAVYSLMLNVIPENMTAPLMCLSSRPIPSNLNTPQNLGSSPKIHLQEEFLVPKIDSLYARETVVFTVNTTSYFRVYIEPHHIDIDLKLEEGSTTVAQAISFNAEETLAWIAKPNMKYTLTITYYKWYFVDHGNDPCFTYDGELAITPVTDNDILTDCTGNEPAKLPADIGQVVKGSPVYIEDDFHFTQGNVSSDIKIQFQITAPSLFRALIGYDFVWNDLALKLDVPGSTDSVQGELGYNKNEISLLTLSPGNYTLHVYEPFSTSTKALNLRNCVNFHLTIGVEVATSDEIDPLLLSCPDQYLPETLDSPAFKSNFSGNNVDFNRYVLADVTAKSDSMKFTVLSTSAFRLYIPVSPLLDIDVSLYRDNNRIALQTSYGQEELIQMQLSPGNYNIKFNYYGLVATSIYPPASACVAFRLEVSLYTMDYLKLVNTLTTSCSTNFQYTIDPTVGTNALNLQRSLETQISFVQATSFTLRSTYLLTVKFEQHEVSSGLAMLLQSATVRKTYNPLYFLNRIYLNEVLPAGSYNLSFHDPSGGKTNLFSCAPYQLTYTLTPTSDVPTDTCTADTLPTDLYTTTGGSGFYGGPQDGTGYIHFFGEKFVMIKGAKNRNNYILFKAPKKSYLRIFMAVESGNTITANLFQNGNMTTSAPITSTIAAGGTDRSNVWVLPGQNDPYVLDLYFTTISTTKLCNYFTFEFVLESETALLGDLACPAVMPSEQDQLPPDTINVFDKQDFNVTSNNYLITSERYKNNNRNGVYTYTMTITVASNSSLSAMVGYDFVQNEFDLLLQTTTGVNITKGMHQESPATDAGINFMSYLEWRLAPGTYRLLLVDIGIKTFNLTNFCHAFAFSLTISSANVAPRILQLTPSSGSDLNPLEPLWLTVVFSEAANIAVPSNTALYVHLAQNSIVYLRSSKGNVFPIDALFDSSYTSLRVRFEGNFTEGAAYSLVFDNTKFTARKNSTAVFGPGVMSVGHNYIMHTCNCNGRGTCKQAGNVYVCECQGNWTGSACDRCATGFHAAGTICVPNVPCTPATCNGDHGTCSDAAGYPVCSCKRGYAGLACDTCAPFYLGYPNCTLNATDTDEDEACTAPLLPVDLNTPAFLGYAGHLHLQGWYYINQVVRQHETRFNLTQQSLFRIYSEPFEIDVDIWLFRVNADGSLTTVAYEISFSLEESFFLQLAPASYLIRFRYYMWVTPQSNCATFNLELAISPIATLQPELDAINTMCSGGLPQINTLVVDNNNAPFKFSQTGYSVSAPVKTSTDANYFYALNITISPPANHVASIHATLGYRFLLGDVSLLLEAGKAGTHCGNTQGSFSLTPPPGCLYGDNLQNVNTLHTFVEPGDYTLWIYEPVRQFPNLTKCAPFDFELTIDFVDDEEDIFSCNLPLIPLSLDNVQYTENPGYIHFKDSFVLDDRSMYFSATQQSFLRVSISGSDTTVKLYSALGTAVATNGDSQNIVASLATGKYYLKFTGDFFTFCSVLNIEFVLAPATVMSAVTCPPDSKSTTPSFTITSYPFEFGANRTNPTEVDFYTFNNPNTPTVAAYPFHLNADGFIDANVESDFLRGGLRLALYRGKNLVIGGTNNYNQQLLQKVVSAGDYELRIILPPGQRLSGYPACIKYNFFLRIHLTSASSPACNTNRLPFTLNTLHFLGYEGTMNFQSDNWRVPPGLVFASFHNINFTVPNAALIRVYTEPHDIDIDIKILSSTGTILISGSNAINTEESLTYALTANTPYILQLQFYNFLGSSYRIPPCESFNMEIEIGPIPTRPATCTAGGSKWPANFASSTTTAVALPFSYNSIDNGDSLFYQQQQSAVSYNITFTIGTAANVHFEVGYDFLVGDLVLKLYSQSAKQFYYGSNKIDRNVINLLGLPKGQYILTIYEAIPNLDIVLGCSDFTFAAYIQEYSALIDEERFLIEYYLPSSLDTLPYLQVSNKVHLSNNLFMFDGSGLHESTTFTIKQTSLLRVDSILFESEVATGRIEAPTITLVPSAGATKSSNSSMLLQLSAGKYTLKFTPPASLVEQNDLGVIVSVQIAINTVADLQLEVNASPSPASCSSTQISAIQIAPNGYYQDGSTLATVSSSTLQTTRQLVSLPFTLTRFSVVYLQVGSQFLLTELQTRIVASDSTLWHGRMRKNINEVHQALPAGKYTALISQPVIQDATSGAIAHCGLFSYSLIIKDANDPSAVVDCTSLRELPWQLDTPAGGSGPFGGPIAAGNLHFYGENMHVPFQAASFMDVTLYGPSLVSVLATGYPSAFTSVDISLASAAGITQNTTISAIATPDKSRLSIYSVPVSRYTIGLTYRRGSSTMGLCYGYTLQIDIQPVSTVKSIASCPTGTNAAPIPAAITLENNYAANTVNSFFQGWSAVTGMKQSVAFSVTQANTPVVVSLAFNSLVTAFSMRLYRGSTLIATAQTKGQATRTSTTNVYLYLGVNVPIGNYTISITHPSAAVPFGTAPTLCAPFIFTYEIGVEVPSQVVITDVDPISVNGVAPTENLKISITFSDVLYSTGPTSGSYAPIHSPNDDAIMGAFYLVGMDSSKFSPISAVALNAQATKWSITFDKLTSEGIIYTLTLKPATLFDKSGGAVTLPPTHTYKTLGCSTNGHFDPTQQRCVCNDGYTGSNCDICDVGYVHPDGSATLCVRDQCSDPNYCGCIASDCSTTRGECSTNSTGLPHCSCGKQFTGERCDSCAVGYQKTAFPDCQSQCDSCVHGTCTGDKKCACDGHWSGKSCDKCPSNFAGADCDKCADGFDGPKCENDHRGTKDSSWGATKTFLEVTGVLVIVALAGAGAFWYWRHRRAGSRYKLVSRFNMEDEDDNEAGNHRFPDTDNRLVDDEDNSNSNNTYNNNYNNNFDNDPNAHSIDDDEEDASVIPSGAGAINSAPEPKVNSGRLVDM